MALRSFSQFKFFNVTVPVPHVVHVEINRPEKLNAFHGPMWFELKGIFEQVSHDPEIRCVLISGAGDRAFTAGMCCVMPQGSLVGR